MLPEHEHALEIADGGVGPTPVGLVDDEHVADLEQTGLARLDRVPQPGVTTTIVVSAVPAIATSTWPTPTVSTRTHAYPAASSTRTACGVARDSPPISPARGHGAHEHAVVGVVILHADAVAEDGAAGEGARGIDREHRHPVAARRRRATRPSVSVDFPAPGAPVIPTTAAFPAP